MGITTGKIKVFIVDDHYMVVEGIRSLLQNEPGIDWLGHASNAESCLAFLKNQLPDVILMDINMPGKNGIELCKDVKLKYSSVFVLGLSTFNQQSLIQNMMNSGASGYVLKNASQRELLDAIEAIAQGKEYLSDEAAAILKTDESAPVVTRREKEVLELLADGLTNIEIAGKLFVSAATVDTHRKSLIAKLGAKNTPELIKLAFVHKLIGN
ncbi:response regulator transcription factor [Lacibacter sediminis]|uniref:Response regulator transcription factor n=1 Tax=Lacibacter sediminis TaxID=2760713 RepID=A0A7G5XLN9_9BACT|nr:response regulator transcription factor [Lacibacter sediminis]QNA46392.1 response regulator transcription factor [Lacibacter sediminis]